MSDKLTFKLDDEAYETTDPILSGRQIRSLGGLKPASEHVLIEVGSGSTRSIGLEETVDMRSVDLPSFVSFRSDRVFAFTVDERGFEWGDEAISVADIRRYGDIPDDHELVLDGKRDRVLGSDDMVRLKRKGVEHVFSREPDNSGICIYVNTREKIVEGDMLEYMDVVKLAFASPPTGENICITVNYRAGPSSHPEGSLFEGQSVRIKKGMAFHVSATDKS